MTTTETISDVQATADERRMPIDKVGVKGVKHPFEIRTKAGKSQGTVALINLYVQLPHHVKGTHMSRFIEILNQERAPLDHAVFGELLKEVAERLESNEAFIEMSFPYFMEKAAPVSGVKSLMDYELTLSGSIKDGVIQQTLKVLVPMTSLCPCSKKISRYGAHNQRSHITISANLSEAVAVEDLITMTESQGSSQLYGVLKRPDEKFVTEEAYDNPKFVEDLARDIALALSQTQGISTYTVEVENFESIHNHSAYALIEGTAF